jgi:hypothetical protein
MLGLIDSVALAPFAAAAALLGGGIGVRAGLTVVALAGVAAACLLVALPRLAGSRRALRFRLGRWLSPRTTSRRPLSEAWALVSACWLLRALASFLLLGTLGVGFSFPLALLFLCAGAAAAAVPIGPAGAATQVGAGAAALIASGVGGSQALAVTLAGGALGVLTGAAIFVAAIVWRAGVSLADRRTDEPVEQLGHIPIVRGKEAQDESSGWVLQPAAEGERQPDSRDHLATKGLKRVASGADPGRFVVEVDEDGSGRCVRRSRVAAEAIRESPDRARREPGPRN